MHPQKTPVAFIVIFFLFHVAYSQTPVPPDSIVDQEVETDTVIVEEDPFVIRQSVFVQPAKELNSVKKGFYLQGSFSPFYAFDYYAVCPNCVDYYHEYKNSVKNLVSYASGVNLNYLTNRLFFTSGVSYTIYRERFEHSSMEGKVTNKYEYVDGTVGGGYRIKGNKLTYILSANVLCSKFLHASGKTLTEDSVYVAEDIIHVRNYNKYTLGISPSVKALYQLTSKLAFSLELYYRGDLTSVVADYEPFAQQRNVSGLRTGLWYKF